MRIGVPKEIKESEFRVGLTPESISALVRRGHAVAVETMAGIGAGISDREYVAAGAEIVAEPADIFGRAALIVKVKEPLAGERALLQRGQIVFTYLHLAADRPQAAELMQSGASAIGYETVTDETGRLPLLRPMSVVAGRMAPQIGAHWLERPHGDRGLLLSGATGVAAGKVVVLGAGTAGGNAALIAAGMGARVTVLSRTEGPLREIADRQSGIETALSSPRTVAEHCRDADVVIATALVAGARAPKLITADIVRSMTPGAVIIDISIDQGGCAETSRVTSHLQPIYRVDGVLHYCVPNMPGAVPRSSTYALNAATLPYVIALADKGLARAIADDTGLRNGLQVHDGRLTCHAVADALGLDYRPVEGVQGI